MLHKGLIGASVWYFPGDADRVELSTTDRMPGTIVNAHDHECVNVVVFDQNGKSIARRRVKILHSENPQPAFGEGFCLLRENLDLEWYRVPVPAGR